MQTLKETKVYMPIDVNVELPNDSTNYFVNQKYDNNISIEYFDKMQKRFYEQDEITHWLKEQTGYFLTKQEMEELCFKLIKAGEMCQEGFGTTQSESREKTKQKYINKLLNNETT